MAHFVDILGPKLNNKDGEIDTATALAGKTAVGLYFSAHWCPPCRGFTPQLAESYTNALKAKGLEVVFISGDRDVEAFADYFASMPWVALPYECRDVKNSLNKKYKVQGIPSFVILDGATGEIITNAGRDKVGSDPTGANFPWVPKPFMEVIPDSYLKGDGRVGKEALAGKTIGIYFSAHWCPPCRGFTPVLAERYKTYQEKGLPFEVIFSTGDRDETAFTDYFKEMQGAGGDWLAIPWDASAARDELDSLFEVQGIPTLVIVDSTGKVINKNARGAIQEDATGDDFPWAPPLVKSAEAPEDIEDQASLIVFAEACLDAEKARIVEEMTKVARVKNPDDYKFYAAKKSAGAVPQIRNLCSLPVAASLSATVVSTKGETSPVGIVRTASREVDTAHATMVMLDIPDNGGFYVSKNVEITEATILDFIDKYEKKVLERKQLSKG